jgi:hypothetical protein
MKKTTIKRVLISLSILAGVLVFISCASTPQPIIIKSEGPYAIGDRGPAGGWIIYDKGSNSDGWRYLEAAPEDQTTGWSMSDWAKWGCHGKSIPGARYNTIGKGRINTEAILKECDEPAIAARRCADYRGGGKSDWFLPSLDELNRIYTHLYKFRLGGLGLGPYWSSSETSNGRWALHHNFTNGKQIYSNKYPKYRVRAVRTFMDKK